MRIQKLQVPAFGPFTNLEFEFPETPVDLQVVFGPNEAGKSSLLRAIRDLLFGIHGQSPDNFIHGYAELRIRGEVRNQAGEQLIFQRRKGNKNTLLDAEGHSLPEDALAPFLHNVDQSFFSAMFGLGARELEEGAKQLLRGEGDMGQALFSASMGGTPVQKVVESLREEAERLFKGRATANVSIRPAINRYKELLKLSRDAVVSPEIWDKIEIELAAAESEKVRIEGEIGKVDSAIQWISRCEDALPTVGCLSELAEKLAQLPPMPELASDFLPRAQGARKEVRESQAEVQRLTIQIGKLRSQLRDCEACPSVLARADTLDLLHQDLGAHRDRMKSLADLRTVMARLEPLIRSGMDTLQLIGEWTSLDAHRLSSPVRIACEEAASALKLALAEQTSNSLKVEELKNQITSKEAQWQSLPEADLTELREALAVAAEATDADRTVSTTESEVERFARETADQHHQVAGAPKDFDATALLPVPAVATIRRFQREMESIQRDIAGEQHIMQEHLRRSDFIQAELLRLQRQGELPSEESLRKAREHRDHGWGLVLAEWKGNGAQEELVPGSPLEEAFPRTIMKADRIADQLRIHAEAAAQAEEKRIQMGEAERLTEQARTKILELECSLVECQKSWQAEWSACGIPPRSPLEMEEWRTHWGEFRERLGKLKTAQESSGRKRQQIQRAKNRLALVLNQSAEKEFQLLFSAAKKRVQAGEQSAGRRLEMEGQLQTLRGELTRIDQDRDRLANEVRMLTQTWRSHCATVGLPEAASPDAGMALLGERKDLLARFDEWREASIRCRSTTDAIDRFERAVSDQALALGIKEETVEALESALWRALTNARKGQTRRDQLSEQIQQVGVELEAAQELATRADQTLKELVQLAKLSTAEELEPMMAHLEQRSTLQGRIENFRNTLGGLARGQAVDEFVRQILAENPDALASRKSTLAREKDSMEAALPALREVLFQLGTRKKDLEKAGDAAADFRQQAASCAATLKEDAARFLRLRLATHLLQNQIEQFRRENQAPLLQQSGAVFRAITRGAFSGLGAEFNADDLPVLVGVRPDQKSVPVLGLSDGSRDQLFLALRLAALQRHLEHHESMPLILDDLLITFDDDRAKAILPQLGALARRTQIFLFTHHEHLVDLCVQTLGNGRFHLHRLGHSQPP